jgi:hypothetical protein
VISRHKNPCSGVKGINRAGRGWVLMLQPVNTHVSLLQLSAPRQLVPQYGIE